MEIRTIKTQKALSPTQITLADFVINPYRGCSLGCHFCYAQANKNVAKRNKVWGEFVDVKENITEVLVKELETKKPKRVLLGSTTEIFMPEEKIFGLSQKIIGILAEKNIPLVILTRSCQVEEFLDKLKYNPQNKIYFTFLKRPPLLKKLLEPKTPSWQRRRKTLEKIIAAGLNLRVHIGPFIFGLDNWQDTLEVLPKDVEEIEIEILNAKLGNLGGILKSLKGHLEEKQINNIEAFYLEKEKYENACKNMESSLKQLEKTSQKEILLLKPAWQSFYDRTIVYE